MALDVAQPAADLFVLIACLLVKGENLPCKNIFCVCLEQADFGAWNWKNSIFYYIIFIYSYIYFRCILYFGEFSAENFKEWKDISTDLMDWRPGGSNWLPAGDI